MNCIRYLSRLFAMVASMMNPALAQGFPGKPVSIIVGYSPGGFNDMVAREVGQHLS